mgnify:CR=1 FL=1
MAVKTQAAVACPCERFAQAIRFATKTGINVLPGSRV